MARPLNHRYIGYSRAHYNQPVLVPRVQLSGHQDHAWIISQKGSNKFLCKTITSEIIGICHLSDGLSSNNQMVMSFHNIDHSIQGNISHITNLSLRGFSGIQLRWTLYQNILSYNSADWVYITDNSNEL